MILLKEPMPYPHIIIPILLLLALGLLVFAIRYLIKMEKIPRDAREVIFFKDFESIENNMKTIKS